jgi:ribonuclease P protein component
VTVRFRPNLLDHDRFAISTGRNIGSAVVRNRVRRRLREVLREIPAAGQGRDILVVCRPPSAQAGYEELREAVTRLVAGDRQERTNGA